MEQNERSGGERAAHDATYMRGGDLLGPKAAGVQLDESKVGGGDMHEGRA